MIAILVIYGITMFISNELLKGMQHMVVNTLIIIAYMIAMYLISRDGKNRVKITKKLINYYEANGLTSNYRMGVCTAIERMVNEKLYSEADMNTMMKIFNDNRPSEEKHKLFFEHESFTRSNAYWWVRDSKGFDQAKKFLYALHIQELQNQ